MNETDAFKPDVYQRHLLNFNSAGGGCGGVRLDTLSHSHSHTLTHTLTHTHTHTHTTHHHPNTHTHTTTHTNAHTDTHTHTKKHTHTSTHTHTHTLLIERLLHLLGFTFILAHFSRLV